MKSGKRTYIAIDLKSFYASVECVERGLDPFDALLAVADRERSDKTICLAISPALKEFGISGRPRLFEVEARVNEINGNRATRRNGKMKGKTTSFSVINSSPSLYIDYIAATPRMALYIEYSARVYETYLEYVSKDDIHVYSIDEVFIDATDYMKLYALSAEELARKMIRSVFDKTGITATAGIGENLYLAKVAMDMMAKRMESDETGARIATLDVIGYRKALWDHKPLTDFWRIGRGYAEKLAKKRIYTMGDVARASIENENLLFSLFGVNAELLIDHAWGYESCTMKDIKKYESKERSISSGQVLERPYSFSEGLVTAKEMADDLAIELTSKGFVTDQIVLHVVYDNKNITDSGRALHVDGVKIDHYGRPVPKGVNGRISFPNTSSPHVIRKSVEKLYKAIVSEELLVRRVTITACHISKCTGYRQPDLFENDDGGKEKEMSVLRAAISIKEKFGKNAILRGMNYEKGATAIKRHQQIGGHRA